MTFSKLVRDKIPELIEQSGAKANIRILDSEEYTRQLERKLDEEVAEYHDGKNLEELADILEVVYAWPKIWVIPAGSCWMYTSASGRNGAALKRGSS